jgi:hypothetical protein
MSECWQPVGLWIPQSVTTGSENRLPAEDVAHFMVAAIDRVPWRRFKFRYASVSLKKKCSGLTSR